MITDVEKQKEIGLRLKGLFRTYFEGCYDSPPHEEVEMSVSKFEITDIQFTFKEGVIEMMVTLCRAGLLIGKGGRRLFALENYLSDAEHKIKILITESNLWRR